MKLIAESGATKTSWIAIDGMEGTNWETEGISPYFFSSGQIADLVRENVLPRLDSSPSSVYFYGTGCANDANKLLVHNGLKEVFANADIDVNSDLLAAARSLCGSHRGIACILGTGSNSCYFDGTAIARNNPAPGFILGDEGSGAHLGKKVVQYFIYQTFDEELMHKFKLQFHDDYRTILDKVYKQPWPNRYLASFAPFLSENRGHYMVENIIEDGLMDFFQNHLFKYPESWKYPIHFTGSIAWHFRDVIAELCQSLELELGRIEKSPLGGLAAFHSQSNTKTA